MAVTKLTPTKEVVELKLLQNRILESLSDLQLIDSKLILYREEWLQRLVADFRAYVLADHMEHQEATYVHMTLPRWLRWLDRFVKKEEFTIQLDAWQTYPTSNTKIPELNKGYVQFIKTNFKVE